MKLGIFDSGIGGEALAQALQQTFPQAELIVVNDQKNIPYGDKPDQEIITLTDHAIQPLLQADCDIIVIACNTATAIAIETLRDKYPTQKFIGIEPMVKSAAQLTESNVIAVCATPATLQSTRYKNLIEKYAKHLTIIEPDCSQWAYLIQNNKMNQEIIEKTINEVCEQGADIIVLGCTHYHWIKDRIIQATRGRAKVLEPSEAIGKRVKHLLNLAH